MSAENNIAASTDQLTQIGVTVNAPLLEKIVKGLGIANRSLDASLVAASDPKELALVRTNFLEKKLGITEGGDAAIAEIMTQMSAIRRKQRGAVYYLLTVKFGKESVYLS